VFEKIIRQQPGQNCFNPVKQFLPRDFQYANNNDRLVAANLETGIQRFANKLGAMELWAA